MKEYLNSLSKCPKNFSTKIYPNRCIHHYSRFRDIVFLHRLSAFNPWPSNFKPLSHYPSNLYWTMDDFNEIPVFCLDE